MPANVNSPDIKVIIPARNEEAAIAKVISEIKIAVSDIIVADNGSTDNTGIAAATPCDIIVFLDGDASDYPEDMEQIVDPIINENIDMVIGSRLLDTIEPGSLTPQQRFGNALACWLMARFWGGTFTDLGPFRAITFDALAKLNMTAPTFGWTVEMQVRALKQGLTYKEVPVRYRKRIGKSKISGTVSGVILAGVYILGTIFRELVSKK